MAVVPDEHLQRRVLRRLAKEFPSMVEVSRFAEIDTPESHRALFYLAGKGFVEAGETSGRDMLEARITAKGLDWLQQGGGSQPVSGEMASDDTEALRHFLMQALNGSPLDAEIKAAARERLGGFSNQELKALRLKLFQALAERPEIIAQIITATGARK